MRKLIILFFIALASMTTAVGQDDLVFGDTANTNTSPSNNQQDKNHKEKKVVLWIKNETKGLLIGNPCMEDVLSEMGFNYLIQFKGEPGQKNGVARYFYNKRTKTVIFFRNGPFWRTKLRKRRRECRSQTRDFVG